MLLRVVIKNFLSIGDELEFNAIPYDRITRHSDHVYRLDDKVKLLKSSAIYGANGSGKSNFIKAIQLIHDIATDQEGKIRLLNDICFKLNEEFKKLPTTIEIEFKNENSYFAYGVDLKDKKIVAEWLYQVYPPSNRQELIFERKVFASKLLSIDVAEKYKKNEKDKLLLELYQEDREILPHNKSLLSILRKKDHFLEVTLAFDWFFNKLFVVYPNTRFEGLIDKIVKNKNFFEFANRLLPKLDTGVNNLEMEVLTLDSFFGENDENIKNKVIAELDNGVPEVRLSYNRGLALAVNGENGNPVVKRLITKHKSISGLLEKFDLNEESDGTLRLLDLLPTFEFILQNDYVFFIDEIGRSIHPSLLKELINYLLSNKTSGQLFFTTHESHLLDLEMFRQDEIWFVEKNKTGNTKIYPLSDYKPRYDRNIRKGYLNGRFGAIPFLADFSKLILEDAEAE